MARILSIILLFGVALGGAPLGAAGEVAISGRVLDTGGTALGGAQVSLLALIDDYQTARGRLGGTSAPGVAARATTLADGRFRLVAPELGLWRVRVDANARPAMEFRLVPQLDDVELPDLALSHAIELTVRLADPGGRPRAGRVLVHDLEPTPDPADAWRPASILAAAGDDGVVRLPVAGDRAFRVEAAAPGFAPPRIDVAAGRQDVRLELAVSVATELRIADPRGRPLAAALAFDSDGLLPLAAADDDGRLMLWLSPRFGPVRLLASDGHSGVLPPETLRDAATRVVEARLVPPLELSGRALELLGREPVSGALVWSAGGWRTEADGRGWFVLDVPAGAPARLLRAAAGDHALARHVLDATVGTSADLTLLLPAAAAVHGRVAGADGHPLSGVDVRATMVEVSPGIGMALSATDPRTLAPRPWRARTDAGGHFRLPGLLAGVGYELAFSRPGLAPGAARVDALEAFESRAVEVVLGAGRSASGLVVDRAGVPVAGARIHLARPRARAHVFSDYRRMRAAAPIAGQATSDADGRFSLRDLGPGRFDLEVRAAGFAPATVPGLEVDAGGGTIDFGTVVLVSGASIRGGVEDSDGQPIAGAEIRARRPPVLGLEPVEERAVSDAGGRFRIADLRPGERRRLTVTAAGYGIITLGTVAALDGAPLSVVLPLAARLSGRVVDADGVGVEDARLTVEGRRREREPATTDSWGGFVLDGVTPGKVTLEARAEGFQNARLSGLVAAGGEELDDLELVLEPGAEISGMVSRSEGEPVAGARVTVVSERPGSTLPAAVLDATADGDGRYRIDGVPPGPASVAARTGTGQRVEKRVEIALGEQTVDLDFAAGYEVAGRVERAGGLPVVGAAVSLESLDGFVPEVVSTYDGAFAFTGVPPGSYRVTATREGYSPAAQVVTVETTDAGWLRLRLKPGAMVRGRLIGAAFDELASLVVHAFSLSGDARRGWVDYDGRYRVPNLAPGRWIVRAEAAGTGRSTAREVELEAGDVEVDLDLDLPEEPRRSTSTEPLQPEESSP